jgi:hypothetical protein
VFRNSNFGASGSIANDTVSTAERNMNSGEKKDQRPSFTIKRYFKALAHKDSMNITQMWFGSLILPGTAQIYNNQAWKLPVIYGTMGGFIGGAVAFNNKYHSDGSKSAKNMRTLMAGGAILSYYMSVLDGVANYKSVKKPLPARTTIFASMVPGLGQILNGDYWRVPIYYGGFVISGYCWAFNQKQYIRYRNMYIEAVDGTYTGSLTTDDIQWYRNSYRRYRDYSVISTALIYILSVVDANVFANFNNFDISDDISASVHPAVISPSSASNPHAESGPALRSSLPHAGVATPQAVGITFNLVF